jgi:large subunit ribosomal protein L29
MNKASEFRKQGIPELEQELISSLREHFNLRMQQATQQLTQLHQLRITRRKIARLKTLLGEKVGRKS